MCIFLRDMTFGGSMEHLVITGAMDGKHTLRKKMIKGMARWLMHREKKICVEGQARH